MDAEQLDLAELSDSVRAFASEQIAPVQDAGATETNWRQIAELGWLSLRTSEARGGLGQSQAALAAVYRELGRTLSPLPYLETLVCAELAEHAGTPEADALLAAILAGDVRVAIPGDIAEQGFRWDEGGSILAGAAAVVPHAGEATHLLLPVANGGERDWAIVSIAAAGVSVIPQPLWDGTRSSAAIALAGVEAGACIILRQATDRALDRGIERHLSLGVACDSLGGARAIFEETLAYLAVREQFGQAIGSFQALQHRCADLHVHLCAAEALVDATAELCRSDDSDAHASAVAARLFCTDLYRRVAMEAVQMHGGIGYTWEHSCHLYLKRALLNEQLYGRAHSGKDALARIWLSDDS